MTYHYASLAAVFAALALVAVPARVVAAEDVRAAEPAGAVDPAQAADPARTAEPAGPAQAADTPGAAVGNDPAISASYIAAELAPSSADGGFFAEPVAPTMPICLFYSPAW